MLEGLLNSDINTIINSGFAYRLMFMFGLDAQAAGWHNSLSGQYAVEAYELRQERDVLQQELERERRRRIALERNAEIDRKLLTPWRRSRTFAEAD